MDSIKSRRNFLTAAAGVSAYFWIPQRVHGYSAAAVRSDDGVDAKPGMSKWDLDTPALCVDLDKMERNIARSRPHAKTHKTAEIARYQFSTGSIGICCAKLGEAEALTAAGIDKICMTTANPSVAKVRRAMKLAKAHPQFIQAVDSYIRWYNEQRIKISLGSLSPIEYRESLGLTA